MDQQEIKSALKRAPKGLTARHVYDECDSAADLNDVVKNLHALKGEGKIKSDGMRDSQVIYKLGEWDGAAPAAAPAVVEPEQPLSRSLVATKPKRTGSGLRDGLFDMMDRLRDGKVDVGTAKAYAALAITICKSIEIQLEYERLKIAKELPTELGDMTMVPALESR
jgi:hypothetical protein